MKKTLFLSIIVLLFISGCGLFGESDEKVKRAEDSKPTEEVEKKSEQENIEKETEPKEDLEEDPKKSEERSITDRSNKKPLQLQMTKVPKLQY